ncbi:hypothetical protein ACE6H2_027611 [Prunus campanulata]
MPEGQEDKKKKLLPILVNRPKWNLRTVNIEDKQNTKQALVKNAKVLFLGMRIGTGRKLKVKCMTSNLMQRYLAK